MNLIDKQLEEIKSEKRIGLMTHVVVGYPSLDLTVRLAEIMANTGADFIELQIPFSDPLADGPTIMKACEDALESGVKVKDSFEAAKMISSKVSTPLLFMAYFNTVFKYGIEKFCRDAKKAGVSGLIVPDLPMEEEDNEEFIKNCRKYSLYKIHVLSPASTDERLRKNAKKAKGFVYCTARQGITGAQKELNSNILAYLKNVKKHFDIPVAVGFGISKKEHINMLLSHADIAIVGSAILDMINKSDEEEILDNVGKFIKRLLD